MEEDGGEAQARELAGGAAEGGPQQLHAGHDHQENVPAVGVGRRKRHQGRSADSRAGGHG